MFSIVCFMGVVGSGKTTSANLLVENQNFKYYHLGQNDSMIADLVSGRTAKISKREFKLSDIVFATPNEVYRMSGLNFYQRVSVALREVYGAEVVAKTALKDVKKLLQTANVVLDGLRFPEEAKILIKEFGKNVKFIFCNYKSEFYHIDYSPNERFARDLLRLGYEDKQEIDPGDLLKIARNFYKTENPLILHDPSKIFVGDTRRTQQQIEVIQA